MHFTLKLFLIYKNSICLSLVKIDNKDNDEKIAFIFLELQDSSREIILKYFQHIKLLEKMFHVVIFKNKVLFG